MICQILQIEIGDIGEYPKFFACNTNEEVLLRVKEQRNILLETSKRKANWIGHISRRNFLLQVIEGTIEGGIEVKGRR
jgi:hypothetical protein